MTENPVLSQWEQLTTLLAQALDSSNCDGQDLKSSIYRLIHELEAEHRDLLEEANLSIHQLQSVQVQLEKQMLTNAVNCQGNERLQRELTSAKQESHLLLLQLHQVQEELESQYCIKDELEYQLKQQKGKLEWNLGKLDTCKQSHEQTTKRLSWARQKLQVKEQDLKDQAGKLKHSMRKFKATQQELNDANGKLSYYRRKLEAAEQKLEQATKKLNWYRRQRGFWRLSMKTRQKINWRSFVLTTRLARSISKQQAQKARGFLGYRLFPRRVATWITSHVAAPKH